MKRLWGLRRTPVPHRVVNRADRLSVFLIVFGFVRMMGWVVMMVCVGLGLLGVPEFQWASRSAKLVWFVSLISFYANAATDLDALTAAWAALRAGRAHGQAKRVEDLTTGGHADVLERIEALAETIHDHQLRQERD